MTAEEQAAAQAAEAKKAAEEAAKAAEEVDYSFNGKTVKLSKEIVESINRRVGAETHTAKERARQLEETNNTLSAQLEEFKLSQMTEKQKQEHNEQKRKDREAELERKASDSDSKFKNYYLETELFKAISEYEVVNSKQVLNLIKAEYKSEFADIEDGIQVFFNNGSTKFTVQEAVKTFLSDPNNANLIKSSLIPGSGTKTTGTQTKTPLRTSFKRSEIADIKSDAAKEYREALRAGLPVTLTDQ